MNHQFFARMFIALCFFALLSLSSRAQTSINDLKPAHSKILNAWQAKNKGWRLMLEKDYGADNLKFFREKTHPDASNRFTLRGISTATAKKISRLF